MGYYINKPKNGEFKSASYNDKIAGLIEDGAVITTGDKFEENLVCVVNNGPFSAAAYCYSEAEFQAFKHPDGRPKTWLIYNEAKEMSDF